MSVSDDLFSPAALRLLNEFCNDSGQTFEENGLPLDQNHVGPDLASHAPRKRHKAHMAPHVPGCSKLVFSEVASQNRKRARFDQRGREKVALVRKKGACMRCRILKIPVSTCISFIVIHTDQIDEVLG